MKRTIKYKNVVISSLPGSGRSTLARLLHEKLPGWTLFSGGEFMRQYAIENGFLRNNNLLHHSAAVYTENFDRKVDMGMRDWLINRKNMIIESWLCGFLAQGIANTLKILLICEDSLRIDRVANRDNVKVSEAKANLKERISTNVSTWSRMYKKEWKDWVIDKGVLTAKEGINYWDPRLYDLIIDTYQYSKEETFTIAYQTLCHGVKEKFHVSSEWRSKKW